ncbi:MAG: hypothetical protein S4CHLAM81_10660 [Chlamydiales bacterium]|nr:hypothetical protein [Chlamydiales bacterium]
MRVTISCILMMSSLNLLFADFTCPNYQLGWKCEEPGCKGDNDRDQSEGCQWCEEREEENNRLRNEVHREILDAQDPDGAPHTDEEAEAFERSIQSK